MVRLASDMARITSSRSSQRLTRWSAYVLLVGWCAAGCTNSRQATKPADSSAPAATEVAPKAAEPAQATEASASPSPASEAPEPAARDTRVALGEKAPGFELRDQNGNPVVLADLVREKKVAAVFYRSADW